GVVGQQVKLVAQRLDHGARQIHCAWRFQIVERLVDCPEWTVFLLHCRQVHLRAAQTAKLHRGWTNPADGFRPGSRRLNARGQEDLVARLISGGQSALNGDRVAFDPGAGGNTRSRREVTDTGAATTAAPSPRSPALN